MSQNAFPGGNSELEPPDPIPNSEVKRFSADGSVGSPHVRVGHCQDLTPKSPSETSGFFLCVENLVALRGLQVAGSEPQKAAGLTPG